MLLTILKVVAGMAVLGIIVLVLLAVVWGISTSIRERRTRKNGHENS
jgi:Na+-transporting methylmalonyl-CoA/oxaloacetate decarboxylase gamma subunit